MSIKPKTPVDLALPFLKDLNHLLIMTVEPGFGGQKFMEDMLPKIKTASDYIKENNLPCLIEVDGGINEETGRKQWKRELMCWWRGMPFLGRITLHRHWLPLKPFKFFQFGFQLSFVFCLLVFNDGWPVLRGWVCFKVYTHFE